MSGRTGNRSIIPLKGDDPGRQANVIPTEVGIQETYLYAGRVDPRFRGDDEEGRGEDDGRGARGPRSPAFHARVVPHGGMRNSRRTRE